MKEPKTARMGILRVTFEAVEDILKLPAGVKIIRILEDESWKRSYEPQYHVFGCVIEGPGLPEVLEGEALPNISLIYHQDGPSSFEL